MVAAMIVLPRQLKVRCLWQTARSMMAAMLLPLCSMWGSQSGTCHPASFQLKALKKQGCDMAQGSLLLKQLMWTS